MDDLTLIQRVDNLARQIGRLFFVNGILVGIIAVLMFVIFYLRC